MSRTVDELRTQLVDASSHAVDAETQESIETAIELVDELSWPELLECPVCGCVGLPERIVDHNCRSRSTH